MLALFMPVILLGLLELILRLADAGYPTDFLVSADVDGEPVWIENPFFTYQVFSPPIARAPSVIVAKKEKEPDVFRVVVLGESAAQGDPVPAFGPPRMLEYTLREMAPDLKVEVINGAITAINSHLIREIAHDLKKLQPDAVILYIGNNEVIGPYGPGTVFTGFANRDGMIRFMTWVNRSRLVQSIRFAAAIAAESRGAAPARFEGVAMFINRPVTEDDPRLTAVRRRFRDNLEAIIRSARDTGAHVALSTVAVNLVDCPPSISVKRANLTDAESAAWQTAYEQGVQAARREAWPEAWAAFEAAHALDDGHAELNYWMGLALENMQRHEEAVPFFTRAMDRDAFRYRADSALNDIIRAQARTPDETVLLVDAADHFRRLPFSEAREQFIDHVHFSFAGNVQLTRLWAEHLFAHSSLGRATGLQPPPDADTLRQRMMFTQVSETDVIQRMLARYRQPPFDRQLDIEARILAYSERVGELTAQLRAMDDEQIPERFRERIQSQPDDLFFPLHFAQFLVSFNRWAEARDVLMPAMNRHPHRRGPRAILAHILGMQGRYDEAADLLIRYRKKHGYFAYGETAHLINALVPGGHLSEALEVTRRIEERVRPLDYRWRIRLERERLDVLQERHRAALFKMEEGRLVLAEQTLREVIALRRDFADGWLWLGVLQGRQGHPEKGFPLIQQAIGQLSFARAYYCGALWQARTGQWEQAHELMDEALRQAWDDLRLVNSLAWILAVDPREALRDTARARGLLERVMERQASPPAFLLDTWSAVLAAEGDFAAALEASRRAEARAREENNEALLNEILARRGPLEAGQPVIWAVVNRPIYYF
ncbi:MAG TPA: hypothetical protein PKA51_14055 [Kiritimatiellia bacterium]|nr:hypothetical protein [Kiritimatiellia bacterium]